MFTTPLKTHEYRAIVDAHYRRPHCPGWALFDADRGVRGWHWVDVTDTCWSDADAAYRAFVPNTSRRHFLSLRGWAVVRVDDSSQLLTAVLRSARGETAPEPTQADVDSGDFVIPLPLADFSSPTARPGDDAGEPGEVHPGRTANDETEPWSHR